jgi:hypothetical protein
MTAKYREVAQQLLERAHGADPLTAYLARDVAQQLVDQADTIAGSLGNMPRGVPVTFEPFTNDAPEALGIDFGNPAHARQYVAAAMPLPRLFGAKS